MKEFLIRVKKRAALPLILVTVLFAINLFMADKLYLTGALIMGYFTAAVYIFLQGSRIKMSERAKTSVRWHTFFGTLLRLIFLFVVFMFAVKISSEIFSLMVIGFFVFYGIFYLFAILENLRK